MLIEGIPVWLIGVIAGSQGTVGVVMLFWWIDQRRTDSIIRRKDAKIDGILEQYRKDMVAITHMYESNVRLVDDYMSLAKRMEKRDEDLIDTIRLNTQMFSGLKDFLENKVPCYQRIKEDGQ